MYGFGYKTDRKLFLHSFPIIGNKKLENYLPLSYLLLNLLIQISFKTRLTISIYAEIDKSDGNINEHVTSHFIFNIDFQRYYRSLNIKIVKKFWF